MAASAAEFDWNMLIKLMFSTFGSQVVFVVVGLAMTGFTLYMLYHFAKSKFGFFQTPEDKALEAQERNNAYLREGFMQAWDKVLDILVRIERNQESKLSVPQVDTVVHYYISSFVHDMNDRLVDMYTEDDLSMEAACIGKINGHLSTITYNADQRYFSLPNTHGAMIDTDAKINGLLDKGLAYNLYDTVRTAKSEHGVRKACKTVLINYVVQNWKMR